MRTARVEKNPFIPGLIRQVGMRTARRESGCRCSLTPARVPRRIPKGIPSWPYGRFTRYTQGHPIMAIRPFHNVYLTYHPGDCSRKHPDAGNCTAGSSHPPHPPYSESHFLYPDTRRPPGKSDLQNDRNCT